MALQGVGGEDKENVWMSTADTKHDGFKMDPRFVHGGVSVRDKAFADSTNRRASWMIKRSFSLVESQQSCSWVSWLDGDCIW